MAFSIIRAALAAATLTLVATAAQAIHNHLGYRNVVIPLLYRGEEDYLLFRAHAGAYQDIFEQPFRMLVSVRRHAAYTHQAVRYGWGEHRVCVYALAHQFPEEFADQHLVIHNNRNNRREPLQHATDG